MKLKLDENIPVSAQARLAALGFDVDTVTDEGLTGTDDATVWTATIEAGRCLVTQDLDFSDARRFAPGTHAGLVIVRLDDENQWRIGDFLVGWFSEPESKTWKGCLVIATETKVRVLRAATNEQA